jgi:NTP pyrophosphatase (non-canonical NTP hydrolase)
MQNYLKAIEQEVNRAKGLHSWNGITIQQAILNLAEECGEAVRALNNITEGDGTKAELVIELVQTAAMAIRTLELIEGYSDTKVTDFKVGDRVKWKDYNSEIVAIHNDKAAIQYTMPEFVMGYIGDKTYTKFIHLTDLTLITE